MAAKFCACAVPGCNLNSHYAAGGVRGWCRAHYRRFNRYGYPVAGQTMKGAPIRWLNKHLSYDGDDCLKWPYATDSAGYGQVNSGGVVQYVHRIMCKAAHGEPLSPKDHAAHICGNGHKACCNPKHLRWATCTENAADKLVHGTLPLGEKHHGAKLTESQVRKIRALKGSMTQRRIGSIFGVTEDAVGDIHRGVNWAWLE